MCFTSCTVHFSNETVHSRCQSNDKHMDMVRSPSLDDDFVFFTNIVPLNIEQHRSNSCDASDQLSKATDRDSRTCWHTSSTVQHGQHFAIDLLHLRTNITVELTLAHQLDFQKSLVISLSLDGNWWIPYRSARGIHFQTSTDAQLPDTYNMLLNASQFNHGFRSFRYVLFNSTHDSLDHFRVCRVSISS